VEPELSLVAVDGAIPEQQGHVVNGRNYKSRKGKMMKGKEGWKFSMRISCIVCFFKQYSVNFR
jgi:hypothetical protein